MLGIFQGTEKNKKNLIAIMELTRKFGNTDLSKLTAENVIDLLRGRGVLDAVEKSKTSQGKAKNLHSFHNDSAYSDGLHYPHKIDCVSYHPGIKWLVQRDLIYQLC